MDAPKVIITEHLDDASCDWLAGRAEVVRVREDDSAFESELALAEGLIVRTYTQVDVSMLSRAPRLRVVGRAGVGLDNIDVAACAGHGVQVVHTPDANTQAVVEYIVSILGALLRPLHRIDTGADSETWARWRREAMAERQLSQMRLGVLGFGRIGSRVAQVAAAIGMQVSFCDLVEVPSKSRHGARAVDLETLLETSDVLSLHVDGRPENRHLLGAAELAQLKPDAVLINTSRGFVIDHESLAGLLGDRPQMRAALDVHDPEPVPADSPLLELSNAVLLPHAASRTTAAQAAMSRVVRDVARALGLDVSG